jgi:ferrochelatase
MRYGKPSIESKLLKLKNNNCRELIIVPMFPQYSGTTTGSIFDEVTRGPLQMEMGSKPEFCKQLS